MPGSPPVNPTPILFNNLTGFLRGSITGAFGASLASEVFSEMQALMQKFEKSMKSGVNIVQKLKAVDKGINDLMTLLNTLGTVPMTTPASLKQWMDSFDSTSAATKKAIEALGNKQWITMLMQSLNQVEALVKTSSFTNLVQDAVKQLTYIAGALHNVAKGTTPPNPLAFFNAIKALQSDATGLGKMGNELFKMGAGMGNPDVTQLGHDMQALGKTLQSLLNNIFGMQPSAHHYYSRFGDYYDKWIKDTEEDNTVAANKVVASMVGFWRMATKDPGIFRGYWEIYAAKAATVLAQAKQTAKDKLTPQDVVETMNWIETGEVPGIYWTDFPELDHVYSKAIAAIESATQVGAQFSKESIVTINSLMTGMTSVIRTFDKVMMQPLRTVDLSIQDVNKRS